MTALRLDASAAHATGAQYAAVMGSAWPLTGRTEELQAITDIAGTAAAGIVLAGAAGVGKTRLAREAMARAAGHGQLCRFVVATASAQSVPLGAFAAYASRLGPDQVRTRWPGSATSSTPSPDAITALWKDELLPRLEVQPLSTAEIAALLAAVLAGPVESSSAVRIWRYTRGNALYLRQLVADEFAAGRFTQRSGLWVWDTRLDVSPTLAELIDTTVGRQPGSVLGVLDVLAVADPVELDVLADIAGAAAVEQAETRGLVTIDTDADPPVAGLAHPMFGEVRRSRAGTLRLRRLRSTVATALERLDDPSDPIKLVRRALLLVDSDTPLDPELLINASTVALRLMDPVTGERLARRAVEVDGGERANWMWMYALARCDRVGDALAVNADLIRTASTDADRVRLTLSRAGLLARTASASDAVELLGAIRGLLDETGLHRSYNCVVAAVEAVRDRPQAAVDAAIAGLTEPGELDEVFEITGIVAFVIGCGDLGRLDAIDEHAEHGYHLMQARRVSPTARCMLALRYIEALRLGGLLAEATGLADRLARQWMDFPFALAHLAFFNGATALARGDLTSALRWLREAKATGASLESTWLRLRNETFLATALAMSGDPVEAQTILGDQWPTGGPVPLPQHAHYGGAVAEAWVCAASGVTSEAIRIVRDAAAQAEEAGCPAREVWCLQTAAQFGDPGGAPRLAELSSIVQGARVVAAAAHAAALGVGDGSGLLDAARLYEDFGDRIAAADAAAQAALVFRTNGRRGAALTATAIARRLVAETGADTPALRANNTPIPLTERQREIIALAAAGLANREIAARLTMSVRTVEGHLFRASQNTGVNGREELIALLDGK